MASRRAAEEPVCLPETEEDPRGPERGPAQEGDGRHCDEEKLIPLLEAVDRVGRPQRREEDRQQVDRAKPGAAGEHQGTPEQSEGGPAGRHLVSEEPERLPGGEIGEDRRHPREVEPPGSGPPEEVGLAVAPVQERGKHRQAKSDRGLEDGSVEFGEKGHRGL